MIYEITAILSYQCKFEPTLQSCIPFQSNAVEFLYYHEFSFLFFLGKWFILITEKQDVQRGMLIVI